MDPSAATLLFFPLGVLLVAPWREALAALPPALLVARLGCLPHGCCYGSAAAALPELAAWAAIGWAIRRRPHWTTPLVLSGFGLIRLFGELSSLRVDAGDVIVPPALVASGWVVAGLVLAPRIRMAPAEAAAPDPRVVRLLALLLIALGIPLLARELGATTATGAGTLLALLLRRGTRPVSDRFTPARLAGGALAGFGVGSLLCAESSGYGYAERIASVALSPIYEEILFREQMFACLRALLGVPRAVLATSLLFALSHLDIAALPWLFASGAAATLVLLRTGSLALVIGLHLGWNLAATGVLEGAG